MIVGVLIAMIGAIILNTLIAEIGLMIAFITAAIWAILFLWTDLCNSKEK